MSLGGSPSQVARGGVKDWRKLEWGNLGHHLYNVSHSPSLLTCRPLELILSQFQCLYLVNTVSAYSSQQIPIQMPWNRLSVCLLMTIYHKNCERFRRCSVFLSSPCHHHASLLTNIILGDRLEKKPTKEHNLKFYHAEETTFS